MDIVVGKESLIIIIIIIIIIVTLLSTLLLSLLLEPSVWWSHKPLPYHSIPASPLIRSPLEPLGRSSPSSPLRNAIFLTDPLHDVVSNHATDLRTTTA